MRDTIVRCLCMCPPPPPMMGMCVCVCVCVPALVICAARQSINQLTLHKEYKDRLVCYPMSPPGGLFTENLADL